MMGRPCNNERVTDQNPPSVLRRVRQSHEERVLAILRAKGAMDRARLQQTTGLSRTTLSAIVRDLLAAGVVIEKSGRAPQSTTVGRPSSLLELNPAGGHAAGIELGPRHTRVVVVNVAHEVVASAHIPSPKLPWDERCIAACDLLDEVVERADVRVARLAGIGVGLIGPVATAERPRWPRTEHSEVVRAVISQRYGVPVHIDNDARLAALAEAIWGAGAGVDNVLYVRVSRGIGGGLVLRSRLFAGAGGAAGELAHVSVDPDGPPCSCGGRGCLGGFASGAAVLQRSGARNFEELFGRFRAGDAQVTEALAESGRLVGQVLAAACNIVNPDMVVVAGELTRAGATLMTPIDDALQSYVNAEGRRGLQLRQAELDAFDAARGAVALVLHESELVASYPPTKNTLVEPEEAVETVVAQQ